MGDSIDATDSLPLDPSPDPATPATDEVSGSCPGQTCEVKHLEERNSNGNREISQRCDTENKDKESHKNDYDKYALVSIQVFSSGDKNDKAGKLINKKLRINSPHICKALAQVVSKSHLSYYGDQILLSDGGRNGLQLQFPLVEVVSPFALLYHHQKKLCDWSDERDRSKEEQKHLEILFDYLNKEPGSAAEGWLGRGRITFDLLWYIFKPDEYVFTRVGTGVLADHWQILWVRRAYYKEAASFLSSASFVLDCLHTASDGKTIGKTRFTLKISEGEFPQKEGSEEITALSVFPLKLMDGSGTKIIAEAAQRSREFDKLAKSHIGAEPVRWYKGVCEIFMGKSDSNQNENLWERHKTVSRVIVDNQAFMEEFPSKKIYVQSWGGQGLAIAQSGNNNGKSSGEHGAKPEATPSTKPPNLPDDPAILCPPYVYGYCLEIRKWCRFFLEYFSPAAWDNEVWSKHLILPPPQKDLLRSMISNHSFPRDADDARNEDALKGKGLIIVLHGPPGTGKTLTAVAAAEETKKPLLRYPAGELGSNLRTIQQGVKRIVRYATRWKAVLLVDEADVFLESREAAAVNVERNALVAVFLHQLEYSQGIIFLTSNRAQRFDPAIESRVHLSLYYPAPDEETRRKLWNDQLDNRAVCQRLHADFDKKRAVDHVAHYALNGREISNTLNSAITLAASTGGNKLTEEHIKKVLEVWKAGSKHSASRVEKEPTPRTTLGILDDINRILGLFVLMALAVILWVHGYQVVIQGKRDIVMLCRETPQVAHGYMWYMWFMLHCLSFSIVLSILFKFLYHTWMR
ncbi:P-loop containing nucleoside triphosphate hydrolase protein [Rhypophila decipiens]|uniref:P-loop containing nucleoside triphosphate hydrolase protein n=1 Tax=Rhypophila decipiens TaxID=261697 RepID=A0AAN6YEX8_9PEZI|nr:P-loop containing nucleoside triphosphate hydrolase protein [Rhypophila decipiens]